MEEPIITEKVLLRRESIEEELTGCGHQLGEWQGILKRVLGRLNVEITIVM